MPLEDAGVTDVAISCNVLTGDKLVSLKAALGVLFGPSREGARNTTVCCEDFIVLLTAKTETKNKSEAFHGDEGECSNFKGTGHHIRHILAFITVLHSCKISMLGKINF